MTGLSLLLPTVTQEAERLQVSQTQAAAHLYQAKQETGLPSQAGHPPLIPRVLSSKPLGGVLITAANTYFHSSLK